MPGPGRSSVHDRAAIRPAGKPMSTFQKRILPTEWPASTEMHRQLQCVAGFYRDERSARDVLTQLSGEHGLSSRQTDLVSPHGKGSVSLAWLERRWAGRWPFQGGGCGGNVAMTASAAILFLGALGFLWFALDYVLDYEGQNYGLVLPWSILVLLCMAGLWAVAVVMFGGSSIAQEFDSGLRLRLADGLWAVVVHDVPCARQSRVISLLQRGSAGWIATAQPLQRL